CTGACSVGLSSTGGACACWLVWVPPWADFAASGGDGRTCAVSGGGLYQSPRRSSTYHQPPKAPAAMAPTAIAANTSPPRRPERFGAALFGNWTRGVGVG